MGSLVALKICFFSTSWLASLCLKKKKNFCGSPTPPKLKNSSRLMVPPVLQGLISLFPPLNSVGLCAVWQWLVHLVLPAWHILKLTHELTWEGCTAKNMNYRRSYCLPALQVFRLPNGNQKIATSRYNHIDIKWSSLNKLLTWSNVL